MLRVSYVFAIALALVGPAYADDNRGKALKLFEESNKAYKSGKFEDAADLLKKAYALFPEPILMYNLGRAQEGLGDPKGALDSYERYLAEAKQVDDRGAIERRIATLKAQIAKQEEDARSRDENERRLQEEQERRKHEEQERQRLEAERQRLEDERARAVVIDDRTPLEKYGPWTTMGVGGALVGTGIVFGIRSGAKHDDAVAAPGQRDAADLQASAEHYATVANVLFVAGGLVAAGGVAWKVWQWKHPHAQTAASLQVTPTSAAVEWVFP
ncbi:MAG TPA: tetratricopeptide repeat protein [Kofleriaceae bacterium]|nr:tetratricopeptide repeat protein [Kofleriaceae bacterium]